MLYSHQQNLRGFLIPNFHSYNRKKNILKEQTVGVSHTEVALALKHHVCICLPSAMFSC